MIYIIQVKNIQKFKDNFTNFKEITINNRIVLHINIFDFINQLSDQTFDLLGLHFMRSLLSNYKILQIEQNAK